jgi:hypothetical protein
MPDKPDYSSIGPLNAAAQKDSMPLVGMLLLAMVITVVALYIVGAIVNSI